MDKVDLFESLVRYLAIKPVQCEKCDIEHIQNIIKKDKKDSITFIGEHGYFEDLLDTLARRVGDLGLKDGHMYLYVKSSSCKERFKNSLLELIINLKKIFIVGTPGEWPLQDPKIQFAQIEDRFADNHQRFFIYQSPTFQAALVSRHNEKGEIEAATTNDPEAVNFISQIVGSKFYQG